MKFEEKKIATQFYKKGDGRGGVVGQTPLGTYPKFHLFYCGHPFLRAQAKMTNLTTLTFSIMGNIKNINA